MNEQNGPLWRNGQIPTSNSEQSGSGKPSPEQQTQKQNEKSARHKRKH